MAETGNQFERLLEIVSRLRSEEGCPWDRSQSPTTVKNYIIEEAYELVEAVEHDATSQVAEELGDLLFMTIFLACLYQEKNEFNLDVVLQGAAEKMIRRHPHVFGDQQVESAQQVRDNWEEIKRREQPEKSLSDHLNEVPRALPGLMRAHRILSRVAREMGRPLNQDILVEELKDSLPFPEQEFTASVLGKLLLLLVGFGSSGRIRAEEALGRTLERFCRQVEGMEDVLAEKDMSWGGVSAEEERSLWTNL